MYECLDSVKKSSWMYMHDRKCDLLWQTRIITEVYFFVVGGTCFVPLLFVVLALALLWLSWASILPWLTSLVLLGVAAGTALTAREQEKGYKDAPLFLYTDSLWLPMQARKSIVMQWNYILLVVHYLVLVMLNASLWEFIYLGWFLLNLFASLHIY